MTNANDEAPVIVAAASVAENTTAVTTVSTSDPDAGGAELCPCWWRRRGAVRHRCRYRCPRFSGLDQQALSVSVTNVKGARIEGTDGDDIVKLGKTVAGEPFPTGEEDRIFGFFGDDRLAGADGNDVLIGSRGNDRLVGGEGDDRLAGGFGQN